MRGSITKRSKGSWSLILDLGYEPHPKTGKLRRRQKWVTFRGTRQNAEKRLRELLTEADGGTFVEPSRLTLIAWLREWLDAIIKPQCRPATYTRYHGIIENHIATATIAEMPLQKLRPTHLEAFYATAKGSASTLTLYHTVLSRALRKAAKDKLITVNIAADLDGRPKRTRGRHEDAQGHAWTADEARAFLEAATAAGPQWGAFYALAIDTGMRKGELCGLRWSDVDLDAGKVRIVQQLTAPGAEPTFGPPKGGRPRTVTVGTETVARLRSHKQAQAELKMANRRTYHEHGLVFAKDWGELRRRGEFLGQPLQANNLGDRSFNRIIKAANVRRIKFHGLRHTCATLLLQADEPVHVVAQRLGHSDIQMTLNIYAHVLPDMQQRAASTLGAILHGR